SQFVCNNPNTIGGPTAVPGTGAGNVIAGNKRTGISIDAMGGATVQGNLIGVNAAGNPLGNGGAGIALTDNFIGGLIGGTTLDAANIIANNSGLGVQIGEGEHGPVNVGVLGNSIFMNGSLGINISYRGDPGVTPN